MSTELILWLFTFITSSLLMFLKKNVPLGHALCQEETYQWVTQARNMKPVMNFCLFYLPEINAVESIYLLFNYILNMLGSYSHLGQYFSSKQKSTRLILFPCYPSLSSLTSFYYIFYSCQNNHLQQYKKSIIFLVIQ